MLSKIVQRTTFSPWSESMTLPFVRFFVKPKIMIAASFLAGEGGRIFQMTAMSLR